MLKPQDISKLHTGFPATCGTGMDWLPKHHLVSHLHEVALQQDSHELRATTFQFPKPRLQHPVECTKNDGFSGNKNSLSGSTLFLCNPPRLGEAFKHLKKCHPKILLPRHSMALSENYGRNEYENPMTIIDNQCSIARNWESHGHLPGHLPIIAQQVQQMERHSTVNAGRRLQWWQRPRAARNSRWIPGDLFHPQCMKGWFRKHNDPH